MEKKFFAKKYIVIAIVLYYGGIVIAVAGLLIAMQQVVEPTMLRLVYVVPGFAALICSSVVISRNCRCPGCGNSSWPRRSRGKQALMSFNSIKEGQVTCPQCEVVISIE